MQVETQMYLKLVEECGELCSFDIESTSLRGDYGSILCVSVKPYGQKAETVFVTQPGNDRKVVREAAEMLSEFDCWISYYGKGFDVKLLQTRLLKWGLPKLEKKRHIDVYFAIQPKIHLSRKSLAHLLSWLKVPQQKMSVSADVWSEIIADPAKHMPTMVKRCESDCAGLEAVYDKTKHLILQITP